MNEGKYIFCNGGILIIRDRTPYYDLLFAVIGSNSLKTTISSLQNLEELVDEILETLTEREQKKWTRLLIQRNWKFVGIRNRRGSTNV